MTAGDDLVDVAVLQLPLDVWGQAQEQSDALMREFALIASEADAEAGAEAGSAEAAVHHVPRRLLDLVRRLDSGYSSFTGEQEEQLLAAVERGEQSVDLHYRVPREVGEGARELGRMLDEADEYCREGQHLLTLAAPVELVRFRWWFLDQFIQQARGEAPVAWPDYAR